MPDNRHSGDITVNNEVIDNQAQRRFELHKNDVTAFAAYEREGDLIVFTHTVVPDAFRGQGIGGRLIAGALAIVRREGLQVVPQCSFVAAYLASHPAHQDLLAPAA